MPIANVDGSVSGSVSAVGSVNGQITSLETIEGSISSGSVVPKYRGSYDITPADEETVLETQYLQMTDNVRIAPIPSNYGLITWDGSSLTVS